MCTYIGVGTYIWRITWISFGEVHNIRPGETFTTVVAKGKGQDCQSPKVDFVYTGVSGECVFRLSRTRMRPAFP